MDKLRKSVERFEDCVSALSRIMTRKPDENTHRKLTWATKRLKTMQARLARMEYKSEIAA